MKQLTLYFLFSAMLYAGAQAPFASQKLDNLIRPGSYNTSEGYYSLYSNISGNNNTAAGTFALWDNSSGNFNTGVGNQTENNNSSESTLLGSNARITETTTNATAIGFEAMATACNQVRIGNFSVTSIGGQVDWTVFSDGRYKQNSKEDVHGLDFINSLKPITYTIDIKKLNAYHNKGRKQVDGFISNETLAAEHVKAEAEAIQVIYNGFVAQEVEATAKKLDYNFNGVNKPKNQKDLYGLRYAEFVVPLVKAVQELNKENEELKSRN